MTLGSEFPFTGVQSNLDDWRQGANLSQVVRIGEQQAAQAMRRNSDASVQDKFFKLTLTCSKDQDECYFAIPQVLQAKKVRYRTI